MTNANIAGLARLFIFAPASAILIYFHVDKLAFAVVLLAGLSDLLDGRLARREDTVSDFGVFLDLTSDKVFVSLTLTSFIARGDISVWPAMLIFFREFLVMGVRCNAAARQMVIPADSLGGAKVIATFSAIALLVVCVEYGRLILYLATLLTVLSGVNYLYRARTTLYPDLFYQNR